MHISVDPKVDFAFKFLFGRPETIPLLIHFLNALLRLGPGERIIELSILNPFNLKERETDKLSILDIKVSDQHGRRYNIEMQLFAPEAFLNRALYYWARMYGEQLREGQDFTDLRPTISICLINSPIFPGDDYHLEFSFREVHSQLLFTDHLRAHIIELPKFQRTLSELASPLDRWLYFLRHAEELLPPTLNSPEIKEAAMQLIQLSEDDLARELYESRLKETRDMATLRKVAREEGRQEGLEHGELIGRIVLCQEQLGHRVTPHDVLLAMPNDELLRLAEQLRNELSSRLAAH